MCGDVSGQPLNGYQDSRCLEQKLMRLHDDNARLAQKNRDQEHCLCELQRELAHLREEDNAKRVARFAQEKASCVLRHEEQIQKLRHHYEQQLAAMNPPSQVRQIEIDRLRSALLDEQSRATQAETAREAADAQLNRQKRKLLKLQQHQGEHVQNIRKRFRRWASGATKRIALDHGRLVFSMWRSVAKKRSSDRETFNVEAERWATAALTRQTLRCRPTILAITAARPLLSALAAFRAWASAVSSANDLLYFQNHLKQVQTQSASELASTQHELNCKIVANRVEKQELLMLVALIAGWMNIARARRERSSSVIARRGAGALAVVRAREELFLCRITQAWATVTREAKDAARLIGSSDEASRLSTSALATARMELQSLRSHRHKVGIHVLESRILVCLAAPFGAWARDTLHSKMRRRGKGDVVLNSGEAAKRAMKTLEEVRAQHEQELAACKNEVSEYCMVATTASRAKLRAYTVSERLHRLLDKELKEIRLQTVLKGWRDAILSEKCAGAHRSKQSERRSFAALEMLSRTMDSDGLINVVLTSWRKETLVILHQKSLAKTLADAANKSEVAIACVHKESRKALQAAWASNSEASRRNASFERRQAAESDISLQKSIRELLRDGPRPASRPGTARELEEHLESIEKQARDRAIASGATTPSTAASSALMLTEGNSQSIHATDREARRCLMSELLDLRKGDYTCAEMQFIALILQSWRCQTAEILRERWVHAAREGRKGLFVAALAQQARYWMADGFAAWRRSLLEARCERLQSTAGLQSCSPQDHIAAAPSRSQSRRGKSTSSPRQEPIMGASRHRRLSY